MFQEVPDIPVCAGLTFTTNQEVVTISGANGTNQKKDGNQVTVIQLPELLLLLPLVSLSNTCLLSSISVGDRRRLTPAQICYTQDVHCRK